MKKNINTYNDFLAALIETESRSTQKRSDAKNGLRYLKWSDPESYEEYVARHERGEGLQVKEADIRQQAKEKIETIKGSYKKLEFDVPPGVNINDVLDAVDVLPSEDLVTSNGVLQRRDIIMRRCIKHVAEEGKVDEAKLRNSTVKKLDSFFRHSWATDAPEKKYAKTLICKDIPVVELLNTYNKGELDLGKIFSLVNKYMKFSPHLKNNGNK